MCPAAPMMTRSFASACVVERASPLGGTSNTLISLEQRADSHIHGRGRITRIEYRAHLYGKDALGQRIGDRAFEPIADMDARSARRVLRRQHEQDTVVNPLAPQSPGGEDPLGEFLDRLRIGTVNDDDAKLRPPLPVELDQPCGEAAAISGGKHTRRVRDEALVGRNRQRVGLGPCQNNKTEKLRRTGHAAGGKRNMAKPVGGGRPLLRHRPAVGGLHEGESTSFFESPSTGRVAVHSTSHL